MGIIAQEQRDLAEAREWYLRSLAIFEREGDLHRASGAYYQLGGVAHEQWDFATAREWYLKALAIFEKQGDLHRAAMTYGQLGFLAETQGNFEDGAKMDGSRSRCFPTDARPALSGKRHQAISSYLPTGIPVRERENESHLGGSRAGPLP
jgi:tetratricopeptide (TPR) repeat protein